MLQFDNCSFLLPSSWWRYSMFESAPNHKYYFRKNANLKLFQKQLNFFRNIWIFFEQQYNLKFDMLFLMTELVGGFPASRGLSRRGKMKREERDLCRLPTTLPTSFLSRMRSRFLNNQWRFCHVLHNSKNRFGSVHQRFASWVQHINRGFKILWLLF